MTKKKSGDKPVDSVRALTPAEEFRDARAASERTAEQHYHAVLAVRAAENKLVEALVGDVDHLNSGQDKPEVFSLWASRDGYGYHWHKDKPELEVDNLQGFYEEPCMRLMQGLGLKVPIKLKMFEIARIWLIPQCGKSKKAIKVKVTDRVILAKYGKNHKLRVLNEVGEVIGGEEE